MDCTLSDIEVRVLGSLIEKEITTPDYYPLSLNALVAACNQSSNRNPVVHFDLQRRERRFDLISRSALLVNRQHPLLKIDPRFHGTEHLIGRSEDTVKEAKLFSKQFEHALIGIVAFVEEVHNDHIVLLAIAMATADALLDSLRVPRKVVIDHERAELHVDALCGGLGGNHD